MKNCSALKLSFGREIDITHINRPASHLCLANMTGRVYGPVFICLATTQVVKIKLIMGEYKLYPPGLIVTFFSQ